MIDQEVSFLVKEAYQNALAILSDKKGHITRVTEKLMKSVVMTREEFIVTDIDDASSEELIPCDCELG